MIIVLIGSPGSGKGTQGQLLAKELNLPYVSVGDIFRIMVENNDDKDSLLIADYMDKGKLVPTQLVNNIIAKFLLLDNYKNGCILDGYPRNLEQTYFLQNTTNQDIKIFYFNIDEQMIIKRILGRFSCVCCGKIYNSYFIKPKVNNICDICGSREFIYRKDDCDEQIIKKRIEEYKVETYPLIEYYKNSKSFYNIDANKDKYEIKFILDGILKMI